MMMKTTVEKIELTIKGTEQKSIALDYHLPAKISGPMVVYAHGFKGFKDWGGMDLVAQQFARKGMVFVKFNFSHNGTTPEQPTEFVDLEAFKTNTLSKELNDLYIVFNWIEKELTKKLGKTLPKVLIGHSKGGAEAILFATRKKGLVSKLITWSAAAYADIPWHNWPTDQMFAWKKTGSIEIENQRTKQKLMLGRELYEDYENHKSTYDVVKAATSIDIPWLICHGTDDETVEFNNAETLKKCCPTAELLRLKGSNHTYGRTEPWTDKSLPAAAKKVVEASIKFALK